MRVSRVLAGTAAALALSAGIAAAQGFNLYGNTGLIDMPTAEMQDDGQLSFTYSRFDETERTAVHFQALPWLAGTVRYSTVRDTLAGPDRSDQSFDLRFRLMEEGEGWRPGVALGFRDILGSGVYGSEYLVATKTVAPGLKVTGGIGWGRLGSFNGFDNPLGPDVRPAPKDPGGQLQERTYFRGDAALFGGLEWQTPIEGLSFQAEYSSDDYGPEQAGGFDKDSPFNFGLSWQATDYATLSASYLYGNTLGLRLTFSANPREPLAPQDLGTGPVPVRARAADAPRGTAWASSKATTDQVVTQLAEVLKADGIVIEEARITGDTAELYIDNTRIQREPKAIGRVARILASGLPASVETFRITPVVGGLPTATVELKRSDIEAQVDRPDAAPRSWDTARLVDSAGSLDGATVWRRPVSPRFTWSLGPEIPTTLFSTEDGVDPDVLITARANYQLTRGLSVSAEFSRFLIGEDQRTVSTSTSTLPRVRSDADLYYSGRDVEIERLTADYVFKPAPQLYGRISAGHLERMFAGVSGELLWAPANSDIALGAELNYARQRDFDDPFSLLDYDVVTGHASIYWDTGYRGIEAQLDAGRYLAGDWGATLTLSRQFANGWDVSAFLTRTEVSFDEFGEGSFAKGFRVTMPLRWGLPFETKSEAELDLITLDNDGGARLDIEDRLYERIRDTDRRSLEQGWVAFWQ